MNTPRATASVSASADPADAAGSASGSAADSGASIASPRWLGKRVGRFKLISLLGKGAYGRVFLAEDVDLHRRVALKLITVDAAAQFVVQNAADDGETIDSDARLAEARHAVGRLIREARAAARIEHPGVVQIFEVGRLGHGSTAEPSADGVAGAFIAMELCDGGTLQDLVDATGPMDAGRACGLIAEAAEALHFGHRMGVVHRDVKPANLMLSRHGRCKVADFGLAYIDDAEDGFNHTAAAGTALYMAPEVVLGGHADARSDQYSLAATLFTLLAGRPPYVGDRRRVLKAHVEAPPPDLGPVRPDVDARLAQMIRKAMSKDPGERFETIAQFGRALRLFTVEAGAASSSSTGLPAEDHEATMAQRDSSDWSKLMTTLAGTSQHLSPTLIGDLPPRRSTWPLAATAGAGLVVLLLIAGAFHGLFNGDPGHSALVANAPTPPTPPTETAETAAPKAGDIDEQARPAGWAPPPDVDLQSNPQPQKTYAKGEPIPATEFDLLLRIARGEHPDYPDKQATVIGDVSYARTSQTGRVFRLFFKQPEEQTDPQADESANEQLDVGFGLVWFPRDGLFEKMEEAFGGEHGSGLLHKTIRVTGTLSVYGGDPQIIVNRPSQITVVEADKQDQPDQQDRPEQH